MIIVDDVLVSDELKDVFFSCNLSACKGECCVAGDAGAPLDEEEISLLEDDIDDILPYVPEKGAEVIKRNGVFNTSTTNFCQEPSIGNLNCDEYLNISDIIILIEIILKPLACKALKAVSRPEPGPFTSTDKVFIPYSNAFVAAVSAAICAA